MYIEPLSKWKNFLFITTVVSLSPISFGNDGEEVVEKKAHSKHHKKHHHKKHSHMHKPHTTEHTHHHKKHSSKMSHHLNHAKDNQYTLLANIEQNKKSEAHKNSLKSATLAKPDLDKKITPGEFKIPGTDTRLKIYGYVKLDAIYDAGAPSGDSSVIPALALKNFELNANRTGVTRFHARQSRFGFKTTTPSAYGDIKTMVEGDFFGSNNFANTAGPSSAGAATPQVNRSTSVQTNAYNLRLRHAYGEIGNWGFGQTFSVFSDYGTLGNTVEFNGPSGTNLIRQPQIRYTKKVNDRLTVMAALEAGNSDYFDQAGLQKGEVVDGIGDGFSGLPDLTFSAKYTGPKDKWYVALRGMARQIRVRIVSNTPSTAGGAFSEKKLGYGLGASFKVFTHGKSSFFTQANFGEGIGRYIFDLSGMGAAINTVQQRMKPVFGLGWLVGYEHYWTDKLRSNLIWSVSSAKQNDLHTPVNKQNNTLASNTINKKLKAGFVNFIYSPKPNIDFGVEFAYFRRETIAQLKGTAKRLQFCATYRF